MSPGNACSMAIIRGPINFCEPKTFNFCSFLVSVHCTGWSFKSGRPYIYRIFIKLYFPREPIELESGTKWCGRLLRSNLKSSF